MVRDMPVSIAAVGDGKVAGEPNPRIIRVLNKIRAAKTIYTVVGDSSKQGGTIAKKPKLNTRIH